MIYTLDELNINRENIINKKSILSEDIIDDIDISSFLFNEDFKLIYNFINNTELVEGKEISLKTLKEFKRYKSKSILTESHSYEELSIEEFNNAVYYFGKHKGKNQSFPYGEVAVRISKFHKDLPIYYNYQYNTYNPNSPNCIASIFITFDSENFFNSVVSKSISSILVSIFVLTGVYLALDDLLPPSIKEFVTKSSLRTINLCSIMVVANKLYKTAKSHSLLQHACDWINKTVKDCPFEYESTMGLMKNIKNPFSSTFVFNIYAFKKI